MKLIVGFDRSAESLDALALGRDLGAALGAELLVACAYDGPAAEVPDAEEYFTKTFASATSELGDEPFVRCELVDSPVHGLRALAREEGAAAIVVGSTHRGRLGRVVPGTTGEQLVRHPPCAVAVAGRGFRDSGRLDRVGVAYDGSREADRGLATAAALSRRLQAEIRVITARATPGPLGAFRDDVEVARARAEEQARRGLESVPEDIVRSGVIRDGDAASALATEAENLDLLVLGSRGHGAILGALLGSVSTELARRAACSVLVVPPSGARLSDQPREAEGAVT